MSMSNREDHWVDDAGRGSYTEADYLAGDAAYDAVRDDAAEYVLDWGITNREDPWGTALTVHRARTMSPATAARVVKGS